MLFQTDTLLRKVDRNDDPALLVSSLDKTAQVANRRLTNASTPASARTVGDLARPPPDMQRDEAQSLVRTTGCQKSGALPRNTLTA
ncbi:hypothetical protein TC41_0275 [Alicyclobacillus acidocaldarius subsp. acidocaldarius Tc-4-1]|uniref:Uncharacterized protein n=1 Tax=Alicyclobacillus acidocaldarius (strain Tc-4-1) TaxID=1048834 RepID=F8IJQ8_ALIAT|nr:hypothetical protein TC41_0275 [Alicyclobacillus acidocaldarius subsp. acidocaldarius Tc-4-1]